MVQLLNLVIHNLAAPALHNSGFAVSIMLVSKQLITVSFKIMSYDVFKIFILAWLSCPSSFDGYSKKTSFDGC